MNGAIAKAEEIVASDPERYVLLQQFKNPANPAIHESTTGPEIWDDTDGAIDILVSGVGTGGTITGVSRYIKKTRGKPILSVAVEPTDSPVLTQTRAGRAAQAGPAQDPGHRRRLRPGRARPVAGRRGRAGDQRRGASTSRAGWRARRGSCRASPAARRSAVAVRLARQPQHEGKTIVVVLPDSGERYLSSVLFEGIFDPQGKAL